MKFVYTPTPFMLQTSKYSKSKADHAVAFIELLQHTKGEWAGKPFKLFPWQEQIVRDVFGIVDKTTGYRQFRTVFIEIPKKQGKSEMAAAIALYLLCADNEFGAEIYGAANDRKQASIVFDLGRDMIKLNNVLRSVCKINETQKRIIYYPTNSFYVAVSSEVATKFGLNVHGCIFDELHGQTDRKLFDAMMGGSGAARRQPLNFIITTAGNSKTSICWEVHNHAMDLIEGRKIDARFYPVVYSAPQDADWTDPEVWRSVNPSMGYTVPEEFYHDFCEQAKQDTGAEMQFRQHHLNQWLSVEKRWLPMDKYDKGAKPFKPEDLRGKFCYGGLDLASTTDIAAFVLVFPPQDGDENYYVLPYFWIPRDNMARRVRKDHVQYGKWAHEGYLNTTDGNIIYYDFIERKIVELSEMFRIKEVAFDEWGAVQMSQNLEGKDFRMIKCRQGYMTLSPPSKELMRLVLDEKLIHGGHPVLRWMFENVYIEMDAAGNIKPSKQKSTEKIDGAVATIMALDRALRQEEPKKSVYEKRGLVFLPWN